MSRLRSVLQSAFVLVAFTAPPSQAQWVLDGTLVSSASGSNMSPRVIPDGAGGAFIAWQYSGPSPQQVFVSRLLPDGEIAPGFPPTGLPVSPDPTVRDLLGAGSDGDHGILLGWLEPTRAMATRLRGDGTPATGWSVGGDAVALRGGPGLGFCADGVGGAWFWSREDISFCPDICYNSSTMWAQHIAPSGGSDTSPREFASAAFYGAAQGTVRAGASGVGFMVGLGGSGVSNNVLRVVAPDSPQWSRLLDTQHGIVDAALDDGAGGALLVTEGSFGSLPARLVHLTSTSALDPGWPDGGVPVRSPDADLSSITAVAGDAGSTLIAWAENGAAGTEVRMQKIAASGSLAPGWPAAGLVVCDANGSRDEVALAPDGAGGAFVAWRDGRDGAGADLYTHHVHADGSLDPAFGANGLGVVTLHAGVIDLSLAAVGPGAAVVAWSDRRSFAEIRAQKLPLPGTLSVDPGARASVALSGFVPNPSREGRPRIAFTLARDGDATLEVFDVLGRRVHEQHLAGLAAGPHSLAVGRTLPAGLYGIRLRAGAETHTARGMISR